MRPILVFGSVPGVPGPVRGGSGVEGDMRDGTSGDRRNDTELTLRGPSPRNGTSCEVDP